MKRAIIYGTWIGLLHFLMNIIHGVAHSELQIGLDSTDRLFVLVVILFCPLLAVVALWARQLRMGLVLLTISMGSSLAFGIYKHFVAPGPDRIGGQSPGLWGAVFAITAVLLAIAECAGAYIGLHFLRALHRKYSVADLA